MGRRGRRCDNGRYGASLSGATTATGLVTLPEEGTAAAIKSLQPHAKCSLVVSRMQTSKWEKYPSINDVDLVQVEKIRREVEGLRSEFVALEKVHGSNFAFETNGHAVSYFSRNRCLEAKDNFVGKTAPIEAMRSYHGAVAKAFHICSADVDSGVKSVIIYGEYFGGWYPHAEVKQEGPGAGTPVQKGIVAYAPDHHFFAFDVCVDGTYLDYDAAQDVLVKAGFPLVAAPIVHGSFEDCMRFDVDNLHTTIPGLLGLPPCHPYSVAEGLVIRPVCRREDWTVKRKSVRYLEACPDELRKWLTKCVDDKEEAFVGLYLSLCQLPRLEAVLSKEPQLWDVKALSRVQQLFREDVQETFEKKLQGIKVSVPKPDVYHVASVEGDQRVALWLSAAVAAGA